MVGKPVCPVCGGEEQEPQVRLGSLRNVVRVSCGSCGEFVADEDFLADSEGDKEADVTRRKLVAKWLWETKERGGQRGLGIDPAVYSPGKPSLILRFDDVEKLAAPELTPLEKYDQTLVNMARRSSRFGHPFGITTDRYVVPTLDDNEARAVILALEGAGLVKSKLPRNMWLAGGGLGMVSLTPEGLARASEIMNMKTVHSRKAFVAAHFAPELKPARDAIRKTIEQTGYEPVIVNETASNEIIDIQIYDGIRHSRFMVADLTNNRQSVYYEVGFAHGLGIDVTLTCRGDCFDNRDDDFKRVHFDINHRPVIRWDTPEYLAAELEQRILQNIGKYSV